MEYISPAVSPARSHNLIRHLDRWADDLRTLVRSFHEEGLVHGDLREPNILCDGERALLVDFDWGGVVGEARYPHARLCPVLMDGRVGTDPRITKDDDERVLQNTLEGLEGLKEQIIGTFGFCRARRVVESSMD
jgi:tRNA A-37 threonylcarbamoyl transferase component Bud32